MNLTVLDINTDPVAIMEGYDSAIWTDRYSLYGDFELQVPISNYFALNYLLPDNYLGNTESEHLMIIEDISVKSDTEDGVKFVITGRSLESILTRRIVWGQITLSGSLQLGIKKLLDESIIIPTLVERKIDNFIFEISDDPYISELTIEAQYTGDNIYDVISSICSERGIGFKVTLNENKQFVFKLYAGEDRAYDQTVNPYVVFSPKFDNLSNSNYFYSKASFKNATLIGGEGEGSDRRYTSIGDYVGLSRREIFTDARDISSKVDGVVLTEEEYIAQLQQRGKENLLENSEVTIFDGQIEVNIMFQINKDFFIGDIVQIADEYGNEKMVRIIEVIRSDNEDGDKVYPTCQAIT